MSEDKESIVFITRSEHSNFLFCVFLCNLENVIEKVVTERENAMEYIKKFWPLSEYRSSGWMI